MPNKISPRQREILDLLLKNRAGLSIDEIASTLNISRNAVQQHLSNLEKDVFIQKGELKKTAGRPVRTFILTETGLNFFPKQYAWFSELILSDLKQEMGNEAFTAYLKKIGLSLSQKLLARFEGKSTQARIDELMTIMDELGYQTTAIKDNSTADLYIDACNCIYHDLAQEHIEICELDKALISTLLNKDIEQVSCMAKGEHICRFKIKED